MARNITRIRDGGFFTGSVGDCAHATVAGCGGHEPTVMISLGQNYLTVLRFKCSKVVMNGARCWWTESFPLRLKP